jgi:hypothetical protein
VREHRRASQRDEPLPKAFCGSGEADSFANACERAGVSQQHLLTAHMDRNVRESQPLPRCVS